MRSVECTIAHGALNVPSIVHEIVFLIHLSGVQLFRVGALDLPIRWIQYINLVLIITPCVFRLQRVNVPVCLKDSVFIDVLDLG